MSIAREDAHATQEYVAEAAIGVDQRGYVLDVCEEDSRVAHRIEAAIESECRRRDEVHDLACCESEISHAGGEDALRE